MGRITITDAGGSSLPPPPPPPPLELPGRATAVAELLVSDALPAYRPMRRRTGVLLGWIAATVVLIASTAVLSHTSVDVQGRFEVVDGAHRAVLLATIAALVGVVVLSLAWLHRATSNVRALGSIDPGFSPASAIWWWVVPFANLVKPVQLVAALRNDSDPAAPSRFRTWSRPSSTLVGLWWAGWIGQGLAGRFLDLEGDSQRGFLAGLGWWIGFVGVVLVLWACIVHRISTDQRHRAVRLARRGDQPPALADHAAT